MAENDCRAVCINNIDPEDANKTFETNDQTEREEIDDKSLISPSNEEDTIAKIRTTVGDKFAEMKLRWKKTANEIIIRTDIGLHGGGSKRRDSWFDNCIVMNKYANLDDIGSTEHLDLLQDSSIHQLSEVENGKENIVLKEIEENVKEEEAEQNKKEHNYFEIYEEENGSHSMELRRRSFVELRRRGVRSLSQGIDQLANGIRTFALSQANRNKVNIEERNIRGKENECNEEDEDRMKTN